MSTARTHPRLRCRDDGLTLMEMVVAIGILMVVLISSLTVFITVQHSQSTAEGTDRAIQLASGRIERIRQLDWNQVGFYDNTFNTNAEAAGKNNDVTTWADYQTTMPAGENAAGSVVKVGYMDPNSAANRIDPYQVTTETGNTFTVYTSITWGVHPTYGAPIETGSTDASNQMFASEVYSFKRVRVTVKWRSNGNGALHTTVNETWFAPNSDEEAPPGVIVRQES